MSWRLEASVESVVLEILAEVVLSGCAEDERPRLKLYACPDAHKLAIVLCEGR